LLKNPIPEPPIIKFVEGSHCTWPLRIGDDGLCLKDCVRSWDYMYIKIVANKGSEEGVCTRLCPTNKNFNKETKECEHACVNSHYDYEGFCIPGCPDEGDWVYNPENGVCEIQVYTEAINWVYIVIITLSVPLLVCFIVTFYYFRKLRLRKLFPVEHHLAVALAKIHNVT
jgi:hypothetical protein